MELLNSIRVMVHARVDVGVNGNFVIMITDVSDDDISPSE